MKRNFFGEPIFQSDEAEIVLDTLGVCSDDLWGTIEPMDDEDPSEGFTIAIKNRDTADTVGHVHNLLSVGQAIAFLGEIGIEHEVLS